MHMYSNLHIRIMVTYNMVKSDLMLYSSVLVQISLTISVSNEYIGGRISS